MRLSSFPPKLWIWSDRMERTGLDLRVLVLVDMTLGEAQFLYHRDTAPFLPVSWSRRREGWIRVRAFIGLLGPCGERAARPSGRSRLGGAQLGRRRPITKCGLGIQGRGSTAVHEWTRCPQIFSERVTNSKSVKSGESVEHCRAPVPLC